MKHTKRIVVFAASLLAVAGESAGQNAYERACLEAFRWEVYAAGDEVKQARKMLDSAIKHRASVEPGIKKARNKVMQEKDLNAETAIRMIWPNPKPGFFSSKDTIL